MEHDVRRRATAVRAVGIPVLWINRKRRTSPGDAMADFVAEDLGGLPAILNDECPRSLRSC
jgi:hypothetical protein